MLNRRNSQVVFFGFTSYKLVGLMSRSELFQGYGLTLWRHDCTGHRVISPRE